MLTGYFMGGDRAAGARLGPSQPGAQRGDVVLPPQRARARRSGVAAVAVILAPAPPTAVGRGDVRPAPARVAVTATVNWDLLAVGLAAFFLYAWARRQPGARGGHARARGARPSCSRCSCSGRSRCSPCAPAGGGPARSPSGGTFDGCGRGQRAGVLLANIDGWDRFWELSTDTPDRLGHVLVHRALPRQQVDQRGPRRPGAVPVAERPHPAAQHAVATRSSGWAAWRSALLALLAPRRPRLAQLAFLVVARSSCYQQGVVAAVRAVADPAGGAGPAALGRVPGLAGRRGGLLPRLLRGDARTSPASRSCRRGLFVLAATLRWTAVVVLVHRRPRHPPAGAGRGPAAPTPTIRTAGTSTGRRTQLVRDRLAGPSDDPAEGSGPRMPTRAGRPQGRGRCPRTDHPPRGLQIDRSRWRL